MISTVTKVRVRHMQDRGSYRLYVCIHECVPHVSREMQDRASASRQDSAWVHVLSLCDESVAELKVLAGGMDVERHEV